MMRADAMRLVQRAIGVLAIMEPTSPRQDDLSELYHTLESGAELSHEQVALLTSLPQ